MTKSISFFSFQGYVKVGCAVLFAILFVSQGFCQELSLPPRMLAYQYLQQNQVNEAEFAFRKAIKSDPGDIQNYRDLAVLYLSKKNYSKAESTALAGLKVKPDDLDVRSVLADTYIQKGDRSNAIRQLSDILKRHPRSVFAFYSLAQLTTSNLPYHRKYLFKTLTLAPGNVIVPLNIAEMLVRTGSTDSAVFYYGEVKKIAPAFSPSVATVYDQLIRSLRSKDIAKAKEYSDRFHQVFKLTGAYVEALPALEGPKLPGGYAGFVTSYIRNKTSNSRRGYMKAQPFEDATNALGGENTASSGVSDAIVAVTDYTESGEMYLYSSIVAGGTQKAYLTGSKIGSFAPVSVDGGIDHDSRDQDAAFIDFDNDGYPDLFVATTKGILLYKNRGDGTFALQPNNNGIRTGANTRKILFADFDQDGDLDIYASTSSGNQFFRNNSNGTFTEQAGAMGLAITGGAGGMDFCDYDEDGDVDIVTAGTSGVTLLNNHRHAKFADATSAAGLKNAKFKGKTVAFADYNNDGLPDLFVAGEGQNFLLKNIGGTHFSPDVSAKEVSAALGNVDVYDAAFLDYDNDGYMDLLVTGKTAGSAQGVKLFHNTSKGFEDVSSSLPQTCNAATGIAIADFNADGDDDVFLAGPDGVHLFRNDVGSNNHYMQVQLTGLSYGNSKNNRLGIGAQVELKAGDLYQLKTVKRSVTSFGVGARSDLDAVRIIWPNGTPQYIKDPSANERIIEEQMLKGSCPFLFGWNGEKYEFIKDMMWRSALGMPLAFTGLDTTYAFSNPSQEYLLIPGNRLKPKNGNYSLKITEELWEAVYFDKAALTAVDHPDSVDVFADERFVAPPFPGKDVYRVATKHYPVSAADGSGEDELNKIKAYDYQYVSGFTLGKFQGVAEDHDLVLDLGDSARGDSLYLFLRGWIFPSDASINTSIAQSDSYRQHPPSLQVKDENGNWKTVIENIGFPMGKDKMVIANLSGKFLTSDRHIRIQTNLQVYWDEIFFSNGLSQAPVHMQDLTLSSADLQYRGYSAMYTKGGPYGPHWCNYYETTEGQKWRDLTGNYTRYGDVLPLLQEADDEYIIADGGDEISLSFDAANLPPLPKGWTRDFLIYSEGWVKDGDLNTAHGQTVAPLPFHQMPSYPYTGSVAYPSDARHQQYQKKYNTREVSTDAFKNALKTKE